MKWILRVVLEDELDCAWVLGGTKGSLPRFHYYQQQRATFECDSKVPVLYCQSFWEVVAAQGAQNVEVATARRRKNRKIISFAVVFRSVQLCLNFEESEH